MQPNAMPDSVKIIECPRDAWQSLSAHISAQAKADYLRQLIDVGFAHIDAVSFVSPAAVPQMADSEQVLALLNPPPHVEIIGIVVNERGAERAIATGRVRTLGFPFSISPEFLRRNQHQTSDQAMCTLRSIASHARQAKLNTVAYISMAFGNPYGDPWSVGAVVNACSALIDAGIDQLSLADTVGTATDQQISELVSAVLTEYTSAEIGVHLHVRRDQAATHIRAAYKVGCRRFDAAIGGLGGCPFAQDELVANIPTEILIEELKSCCAQLPEIAPLDKLIRMNAELARQNSTSS